MPSGLLHQEGRRLLAVVLLPKGGVVLLEVVRWVWPEIGVLGGWKCPSAAGGSDAPPWRTAGLLRCTFVSSAQTESRGVNVLYCTVLSRLELEACGVSRCGEVAAYGTRRRAFSRMTLAANESVCEGLNTLTSTHTYRVERPPPPC